MIVKITWKRFVASLAALILFGFALAWSGIINIGASTGHWAVTDWFLHWAMRNTVRTQAWLGGLTVRKPAAHSQGLVSAAGHYAASCAACHGAPGVRPVPVMQASTPPAPDLRVTASEWTDEELFWIIKHGVKFTAMPAWPDLSRDDEIRRMAAFVRRLPDMTAEEYRELAYGPGRYVLGGTITDLETALPDCMRCHGSDGRGRGQPDIPVLAGQSATYLYKTLEAYASGRRGSGVMGTAAARLDPAVMRALAEHYASLPGLDHRPAADSAVASAREHSGAAGIVAHGLPDANVPACSTCHASGKNPRYPILAGQKPGYLATWLHLWHGDETIVDAREPNAPMPVIARRLPESAIELLAEHYSRQ